jgi:phage terminase Nu1 subunit (DNA packaging protein)
LPLSLRTADAHKRWNEENRALVESHQKYLQELTIEYEEKLLAEQHKQKQLSREKEGLKVRFGYVCAFLSALLRMECALFVDGFQVHWPP